MASVYQGGQGVLGGFGDGGVLGLPGAQGLAGGEVRRGASQSAGGGVAAGYLLGDQKPQDLDGVPALRAGGGQHVGGGFAHVGRRMRRISLSISSGSAGAWGNVMVENSFAGHG